ncbi:MAG: AEC family transporter [Bacteroidetes bacterium]|nr:AEC family transporter [Bacteroidota bacterium]
MEVLTNVGPVILIAIAGFLLKKLNIFRREHGDFLLMMVFYLTLPALIFDSFLNIKLDLRFAYLPMITVILIIAMYLISLAATKIMKLPGKTAGTFIVGTMILNNGFLFPFIYATYGDEGMARILIFDFVNGLLAFSWVYYIACRYGENGQNRRVLLRKLLFAPPGWSIIISITLNLLGYKLPLILAETCDILGEMTVPLIMLALGIYFSPRLVRPWQAMAAIGIRMGIGFLIGYFFAELLTLEGLTRTVVILGASAPIGFNTLTFASMEKLDRDFAASLVSFAILAGMLYVTIFLTING